MAETIKKTAWDKKETVYIPKVSRGEQPTQYVSVNGHDYFVPKGESVEDRKSVV